MVRSKMPGDLKNIFSDDIIINKSFRIFSGGGDNGQRPYLRNGSKGG